MANPPYEIVELLGEGGMAIVYRARIRDSSGTDVALKVPKPVLHAKERMRREIDMQQRYAGEHVMEILASDRVEPWLCMPIAQGNLFDMWQDGDAGSSAEQVSLAIFHAATLGMSEAHRDGAVHRDLTPGNFLAIRQTHSSADFRWVISDWGLARRPIGQTSQVLTGSRAGMGTPGFGAPETWISAHAVDARADVYSLGRIVAWLLTGQIPTWNLPLLPSGRLRGFVAQCTEADVARRPGSLDEALRLLQASLAAPAVSPRAELRAIGAGDASSTNLGKIRQIAVYNMDNARLYIDDLAAIDAEGLADQWVRADATEITAVALRMCQHLQEIDWGNRHFDYANTPLGWSFEVLRSLVAAEQFDLAEDLAAAFFAVEEQWDRYSQLRQTRRWLRQLTGDAGAAMARAMRRAGTQQYYRKVMQDEDIASPDLADELSSP